MIELEPTKAKKVSIPKRVKRFCVAYYSQDIGWKNRSCLHATPESALEDFLRFYKDYDKDHYSCPKFYTVYEIDLEIPIIAPSK